ncbi:MAG: hypothetical protein HQL72_11150 [Magnetococcales bacterium]|nr:hypothetical protein [Magnetococcales bacterium]
MGFDGCKKTHGVWLCLLLLLVVGLSGCTAGQREEDMAQFFQKHRSELSRLQAQFEQLRKHSPIQGIHREEESVYLVGAKRISLAQAKAQFPEVEEGIGRVQKIEEKLDLRTAYLQDDGSFWVILNEADLLGSDYGLLRQGKGPVTAYGTLNQIRPVKGAKGWYAIRF